MLILTKECCKTVIWLRNFWESLIDVLQTSRFAQVLILGLILRLLIMPFFAHNDFLSEARRVYYWVENGIYVDAISRNATSLFQVLFFKVFGWLIPNKELLLAHADIANSSAGPTAYFTFVTSEHAHRAIFILKLPFLVADLVVAWCIYSYFSDKDDGVRSVAVWLFNPISLFAIYIFVCIGLSINARELFIFIAPVFIAIVLSPSAKEFAWWKRSLASCIVGFAMLVALQVVTLTSGDTTALGSEVASIAGEPRVDFLFHFMVGSWFVFPMALFVVLLYAWNSNGDITTKTILLFGAVFTTFFATSSHTAHYPSWLILFPILFVGYDKALIKPFILLCVSWFFYHASITDRGVFTAWLASPWSINNSGLPMFPWIYDASGMDKTLSLYQFARVWRTFFALDYLPFRANGYYLYKAFKELVK